MVQSLRIVALLSLLLPLPLSAVPPPAVAQDLASVPRITIDELKRLQARKQVVLVDVRDPMAFSHGHIPGAVNVPFDFLPEYVEKWKQDKRLVVTYCACLNEGTAANAALDMKAFGLTNVKALLGGYNEWVKRGEKVAKYVQRFRGFRGSGLVHSSGVGSQFPVCSEPANQPLNPRTNL